MRSHRSLLPLAVAMLVMGVAVGASSLSHARSIESADTPPAAAAGGDQVYRWAPPADERGFDGTELADHSGDIGRVDLGTGSYQMAFATENTRPSTLMALSDSTRNDSYLRLGLTGAGHVTYRIMAQGTLLAEGTAPGRFNDGEAHLAQLAVGGGQVTIDIDGSPVWSDSADTFAADVPALDSFTTGGRISAAHPDGTSFFTGTLWQLTAHNGPLSSPALADLAERSDLPASTTLAEYDQIQQLLTGSGKDENLVYTGDSITHGALWTAGWKSWTEHVHSVLRQPGTDRRVINTAVSGNTSADILHDWDSRVARWDPAMVTVMVGMNDTVAFGGTAGLGTFKENLEAIIGKIRAEGAIPVLAASQPIQDGDSGDRQAYSQYVAAVRQVAAEHQVFVVDHHTQWLRSHRGHPPASWWGNPIHPSARGQEQLAQHYLESVGLSGPGDSRNPDSPGDSNNSDNAGDPGEKADSGAPPDAARIPATDPAQQPPGALATEVTSPHAGVRAGQRVRVDTTVTAGDVPAEGVELIVAPDPALHLVDPPTVTPSADVDEREDGSLRVRTTRALAAGETLTLSWTATVDADASSPLTTTARAQADDVVNPAATTSFEHAVTTEAIPAGHPSPPATEPAYQWSFDQTDFDGERREDHSAYAAQVSGLREGSLHLLAATRSDRPQTLLSLTDSDATDTGLEVGLEDGRLTYRVERDGHLLTDVHTSARFDDGREHLFSVDVAGGVTTIYVDGIAALVESGSAFIADLGRPDQMLLGGRADTADGNEFTGTLHRASISPAHLASAQLADLSPDGTTGVADDLVELRELAQVDATWVFTGDAGSRHGPRGGARSWVEHIEERQRWEREHARGFMLDTTTPHSTVAGLLDHYQERIGAYDPDIVTITTGTENGDVQQFNQDLRSLIDQVRANGAVPVIALAEADANNPAGSEHQQVARSIAAETQAVVVDMGADWMRRNQGHVPGAWLADAEPDGAGPGGTAPDRADGPGGRLTGAGSADRAGHYELARSYLHTLGLWDETSYLGQVRFSPVTTMTGDLTASRVEVAPGEEVELRGSVTVGANAARDGVITIRTDPGLVLAGPPETSAGQVARDENGDYQIVLPDELGAGATVEVTAPARVEAAAGNAVSAEFDLSLANPAGGCANPMAQIVVSGT